MRKHFALVTDHDDPDMVGLVKITDSQLPNVLKNEERVCQTLNVDALENGQMDRGEYRAVGMGYADFEDENDYRDRVPDVIGRKVEELDDAHLEKAGVAEAVAA